MRRACGEMVFKMYESTYKTQLVLDSGSKYSMKCLTGSAATNVVNNRAGRTDMLHKHKPIISLESITFI